MNKEIYSKSEMIKQIKNYIIENKLENIVELSRNNVINIKIEINNKINEVKEFLNSNTAYKTNEYYELIINFGEQLIKENILNNKDIVFYSNFLDDVEANEILDELIDNKIDEVFKKYKNDSNTIKQEKSISDYMINEIKNKLQPYDLDIISKLGGLYNIIIKISNELFENIGQNILETKRKINMLNNMNSNIAIIISNWVKIIGCDIEDVENYGYMEYLYDRSFIPNYEEDLRKVLTVQNIKNVLFKINENSLNKNYKLFSVDEIFNKKTKKNKLKTLNITGGIYEK